MPATTTSHSSWTHFNNSTPYALFDPKADLGDIILSWISGNRPWVHPDGHIELAKGGGLFNFLSAMVSEINRRDPLRRAELRYRIVSQSDKQEPVGIELSLRAYGMRSMEAYSHRASTYDKPLTQEQYEGAVDELLLAIAQSSYFGAMLDWLLHASTPTVPGHIMQLTRAGVSSAVDTTKSGASLAANTARDAAASMTNTRAGAAIGSGYRRLAQTTSHVVNSASTGTKQGALAVLNASRTAFVRGRTQVQEHPAVFGTAAAVAGAAVGYNINAVRRFMFAHASVPISWDQLVSLTIRNFVGIPTGLLNRIGNELHKLRNGDVVVMAPIPPSRPLQVHVPKAKL